tara:strand:- start:189 stop:1580 length:1392 start_codon:yes stop_codon:yes gene_type:complete
MYFSNALKFIKIFFIFFYLISYSEISYAVEIDFTRYLSHHLPKDDKQNKVSFFGVNGPAYLYVCIPDPKTKLIIELNGIQVFHNGTNLSKKCFKENIKLSKNNDLAAYFENFVDGKISIRIKQKADVNLNVISRIHFNTNVKDFNISKAFYSILGFESLSGFPETNTLDMARAMGIKNPTSYDGSQGGEAGGYLLYGELLGINDFRGGVIDLIEFKIPRNEDVPYEQLNHLGMVSATMYTSNLDYDYEYMKENGINFISTPVTDSTGKKFVYFKDPDSTFYKLVEKSGILQETKTTFIESLGEVTINVSDFERSRSWYKMFGYELLYENPNKYPLEISKALGFEKEIKLKGGLFSHNEDKSKLELIQWIRPLDLERPYPIPINHLGIHRIALATSNLEADVEILKTQGVEFISDITPCCDGPNSSSGIVAFYDPDGTIIELAEMPWFAKILFPIIIWFRDLFN